MRGHIRVRQGTRGTTYQLVVFAGVDEKGKRRYLRETVAGSKRDAEKRLAQLVAAVDAGQASATSKARLSDLVDAWWEACTSHLSPHTRIGYRGMLRRYACAPDDEARCALRRVADVQQADLVRRQRQRPASPLP